MENVELVIKIPEEIYELCKRDKLHYEDASLLEYSVANGTPLDKIRAEIERQDFSHHDGSNHWYMTPPEVVNIVVGIIDKYKAESEG